MDPVQLSLDYSVVVWVCKRMLAEKKAAAVYVIWRYWILKRRLLLKFSKFIVINYNFFAGRVVGSACCRRWFLFGEDLSFCVEETVAEMCSYKLRFLFSRKSKTFISLVSRTWTFFLLRNGSFAVAVVSAVVPAVAWVVSTMIAWVGSAVVGTVAGVVTIVATVSVVVVAPTFVNCLVFLSEADGHQESQQGYLYDVIACVKVSELKKFVFACCVSR